MLALMECMHVHTTVCITGNACMHVVLTRGVYITAWMHGVYIYGTACDAHVMCMHVQHVPYAEMYIMVCIANEYTPHH